MRMLCSKSLFVGLFVLMLSSVGGLSAVIYVDIDASGSDTGSSWGDAYTDFTTAVNALSASDEIWVSDGTYAMGGTATVDVDNVSIYGGFDGSESSLSERDVAGNIAILDGGGSVKPFWVTATNVTIDGLTIQNGQYDPDNPGRQGGGIYSDGGGLLVIDCVFKGNRAPWWNYGGGAIYAKKSLTIEGCSFVTNWVGQTGARQNDGGAVEFEGGSGQKMTVKNCMFVGNSAFGQPGQNSRGGAMHINGGGDAYVVNCTFYGNSAYSHGGAIAVNHSSSHLYVTNSIFLNNVVAGGSGKDEIDIAAGAVAISYSDIDTNKVSAGASYPVAGSIVSEDPLFVSTNAPYDMHLKSTKGHWTSGGWVLDGELSPAIDVGNPASAIGAEPSPNGSRINMGAYGGTDQASKSDPTPRWTDVAAVNVVDTSADLVGTLNGDDANATVYWDTVDKGENFTWANSHSFGSTAVGAVLTNTAGSLIAGQTYYFRFYGTNSTSGKTGWSDAESFAALEDPSVDNGIGATDVSYTVATLNGNLTAGSMADVYIYWGTNDGAAVESNWSNTNVLSDLPEGAFSDSLAGLSDDTIYYYRCYASNSVNASWASPSVSFRTLAAGSVVFVDVDASGSGDGSSWSNAYTDVKAAVDGLIASSRQIWVADGTYAVSGTATVDVDNISIYGGFNGTETFLSQRDINQNFAILDGEGSAGDGNGYRIFYVAATNVLIDGLTIQNADVGNYSPFEGNAIYSVGDALEIANCIFKNNHYAGGNRMGGCIYAKKALTVDSCMFDSNIAGIGSHGSGGAIAFNSSDALLVKNSAFAGNKVFSDGPNGRGGAIYIYGGADADVINCSFYTNSAVNIGGAIAVDGNSSLTVKNSILWDDSAVNTNIENEISLVDAGSSLTISYCDVDMSQVDSAVSNAAPGSIINVDPLFAVTASPYDLHLKSHSGRWTSTGFVADVNGVFSPAMDMGDPNMPVGSETAPNGGIVNLGAYGGTEQASRSQPPSGFMMLLH